MDLNKESLPTRANIYIWRGDYVEVNVPFVGTDNNVFSLAGYTGKADIVQNNNVIASFKIDMKPMLGTAVLILESNVSATIPAGVYSYDFQLEDHTPIPGVAVPRVKTFVYGQVIVRDQVTVGYSV